MMTESGFRYIDLNFYAADYEDSPICGGEWEQWAEEAAACAALPDSNVIFDPCSGSHDFPQITEGGFHAPIHIRP